MKKLQIILFIRGLPGSGKTTFASFLSQKFKFKVIDPDLFEDLYKKSERSERLRKYELCLAVAKEFLDEGFNIVWCQPWRKLPNLVTTRKSLCKDKNYKTLLLDITIPVNLSWDRSKTKFNNDTALFNAFISKDTPLTHLSNFEILQIDGTKDFKENLNKTIKFLMYNTPNG